MEKFIFYAQFTLKNYFEFPVPESYVNQGKVCFIFNSEGDFWDS